MPDVSLIDLCITAILVFFVVTHPPALLPGGSFVNLSHATVLCGVAESGEDAITLLGTTSPDLVFIDYILKGDMTGVDLAQYINKKFQIPFIYITAYSDDQIIERVIHTCPAAFILKPFKGEEIRVAVEILINRRSSKKQ